jgi:hypothetical protein
MNIACIGLVECALFMSSVYVTKTAPLVKYTFWCSLGEIYFNLTLNYTNSKIQK